METTKTQVTMETTTLIKNKVYTIIKDYFPLCEYTMYTVISNGTTYSTSNEREALEYANELTRNELR